MMPRGIVTGSDFVGVFHAGFSLRQFGALIQDRHVFRVAEYTVAFLASEFACDVKIGQMREGAVDGQGGHAGASSQFR